MASLLDVVHDSKLSSCRDGSRLTLINTTEILTEVRGVRPAPPLNVKALVVDPYTEALLFAACEMNDVLDAGVARKFRLSRSPICTEELGPPQEVLDVTRVDGPQGMEAMYLLTPTSQNVERIIEHYQAPRKFKRAHLFFTEGKRSSNNHDKSFISCIDSRTTSESIRSSNTSNSQSG